jgi:hypothetical protein
MKHIQNKQSSSNESVIPVEVTIIDSVTFSVTGFSCDLNDGMKPMMMLAKMAAF